MWPFKKNTKPPEEKLTHNYKAAFLVEVTPEDKLMVIAEWPTERDRSKDFRLAELIALSAILTNQGDYLQGFIQAIRLAGERLGDEKLAEMAVNQLASLLSQSQSSVGSEPYVKPSQVFRDIDK